METNTVFLALRKVGVRQYEDSDSKPGVGVSTGLTRLTAEARQKAVTILGGFGDFFSREGFRSLPVLSIRYISTKH